ncbi:DUF4153 domain-containing protein [Butyrivibrio proteoclasticus]|uniref:DUF4153 domain-containing protein n=1 Tax=Butyrivibrio proteoclasticus TaxID=43305 RepID=UPI00047EBC46|nr:DUF4153 domain-containing protein [Butyrivibrio proteoclasticus]
MEETRNKKVFVWAAIASYFVGYFYIKEIAFENGIFHGVTNLGRLVFVVLFLGLVEVFAQKMGVTYKSLRERKVSIVEPAIFLLCCILQTVGIFIRGAFYRDDSLTFLVIMMWYFTIIYYILARTGSLSAGRSGILFPLDGFQGCFSVPVFNGFLRATTLLPKKKADTPNYVAPAGADTPSNGAISNDGLEMVDLNAKELSNKKEEEKKSSVGIIAISVGIALVVCIYAAAQLSAASDTFKGIGNNLLNSIAHIFDKDFLRKVWHNLWLFVMSIPVGAYLFALVAGSIKKKGPYCPMVRFEYETRDWHKLPGYSAYIVVGSVILIYTLFLGSAIYDFVTHQGLFAQSAHIAAMRAIGSFWSLIKVVLLNIAIIAGSCLFSKKALWEDKKTKGLITVLFIYALGFAILAAFNLYVGYIGQYGFTPRRLLSGWVVGNVILWCILLIIRFYKKIPAAQIGIVTAAITFSMLCCAFPAGVMH